MPFVGQVSSGIQYTEEIGLDAFQRLALSRNYFEVIDGYNGYLKDRTIKTPFGDVVLPWNLVMEIGYVSSDDLQYYVYNSHAWDTEAFKRFTPGTIFLCDTVRGMRHKAAFKVKEQKHGVLSYEDSEGETKYIQSWKVDYLGTPGPGNSFECCNCHELLPDEEIIPDHAFFKTSPDEIAMQFAGFVCQKCIDAGDVHYCDCCGRLVDSRTWISDTDRCLCNECYVRTGCYQCMFCGKHFEYRDNYITMYGGSSACADCAREHHVEYCVNCYEGLTDENTVWIEGDRREPYCPHCAAVYYAPQTHSYGFKPYPVFHPSKDISKTNCYFGVELEIDKGKYGRQCSDALKELSDEERLFYLKHDGSLDCGIEIVTHPCTLDYHLNEFPWQKICDIAIRTGFKSHDAGTCGLHVHVSRDVFGKTTRQQDFNIAKVLLLVDAFWDKLVLFSRRNISELSHWANKPCADIGKNDTILQAANKCFAYKADRSRYRAVNLCPSNTVEFRLFRGTLRPDTIRATLEFMQNLVDYVMHHKLKEIQEATFDDVVHFHDYEELNKYVAERVYQTRTETNEEEEA